MASPWSWFRGRVPAAAVSTLIATSLLAGISGATSRFGAYQYVSPLPGSRNVSPLNNVVIRDGRAIDPRSIGGADLMVAGSKSGAHPGRLRLSDDGRTLVFNPDQPFAPGERVAVSLLRAPLAIGAAELPPLAFDFSVAAANPVPYHGTRLEDELGNAPDASSPETAETSAPLPQTLGDLPASYPPITLLVSNNPDPGLVFCTPARNTPPASNTHLLILDNNAMPIFYRKTSSRPVDFKKLPDGRLLYYEIGKRAAYALDGNYAIVDSFKAGNGYSSDSHDTQVLPNDHALILIFDPQPVDMSLVVPGGNPNAIVTGLVLQEIDAAKNVVWQWRSWDHFAITDMSTGCASLTDSLVDYVHGNAIEVDFDGNLLLSGRYLNEITKIDRQTGDVIWRFGRNSKRNQFTLINDPFGFSDQHDVRRLPNGHITLFDNHYCIDPKNTRVLEYELDEQNLTATLVWEYRHTPDQQSQSGGGYQRRDNGGGMIGWANCTTPPHLTDLHADGSIAWEARFWAAPTRSLTYRAYRFPWHGTTFTTDVDSLDFGVVALGDSIQIPVTVTNNSPDALNLTSFVSLDSAFSVVDAAPINLPAGGSVTVQAKFRPKHIGDIRSTLYVRSGTTTQLIAVPVAVHGAGDESVATLLSRFDAGWRDDGIEVRWQLGAPEAFTDAVLERGETATGPWSVVSDEYRRAGDVTVVLDRSAVSGRDYYYRVIARSLDGQRMISEPLAVGGESVVGRFALLSVTPSPSPGRTRIDFTVAREARVRLSVLDIQGRLVAVLADGVHRAGRYQAAWNADRGRKPAAAGIYFIRYEWPGERSMRRLVVTP